MAQLFAIGVCVHKVLIGFSSRSLTAYCLLLTAYCLQILLFVMARHQQQKKAAATKARKDPPFTPAATIKISEAGCLPKRVAAQKNIEFTAPDGTVMKRKTEVLVDAEIVNE